MSNFERESPDFPERSGDVHSSTPLDVGGAEGQKSFVEINFPALRVVEQGPYTFVQKNFKTELDAKRQVEKFAKFRELGLPVPATTRFYKEGHKASVIMTDLTEKGIYSVWSWNGNSTEKERNSLKEISPTQKELDSLRGRYEGLLTSLDAKGVDIPADAWLIRRSKVSNSPLELFLVDITYAHAEGISKADNNDCFNRFLSATKP